AVQTDQKDWWMVHTNKEGKGTIGLGEKIDASFKLEASSTIPYTRPYFSRASMEQPYYDILDPQYLDLPTAPYPLSAWAEFKYRGVTLKLGQVVQTVQRANGLGVVYEPLVVAPPISVQVSPRAGIVPLDSKSFSLSVALHSNVKGPANG